MMMNNSSHEFERLLGKAVLALWADLPRDVQEHLFDTAVADHHRLPTATIPP